MNDLTALRESLFATLADLRAGKIDLEQAKAINDVGKTLIDSAKVEVDYLRTTGGGESAFIGAASAPPQTSGNGKLLGTRTHRLLG